MAKLKNKVEVAAEDLRLLLDSARCPYEEMFIPPDVVPSRAICTGCGAIDSQIMIKKHKKGCLKVSWYVAHDRLMAVVV